MRRRAALALVAFLGLAAEEPLHEMGPFPTREMFPLYLPTMAYQPVDPVPLGRGRWRWALHWIEANTFQFSDIFEQYAPRDASGRVAVTEAVFASAAAAFPDLPTLYYFDEEIARFELEGRYGLSDTTDLWFRLPVQNHTGGFLDPLIEGFHKIGFEQPGRDRVMKNQVALAVAQYGKVAFYNDERILGKTQDPVLGLTHRLLATPTWTLSAAVSLKPPLTHTYDAYRSGWDQTYGITGAWRPGGRHAFYFGGGFVRRPHGSPEYTAIGFRNGAGAHATWEYRRWRRVQPFLQLYWQSGYLPRRPSQHFDQPSLQHDLGVHWHWTPHTTLTFRYLNNISHWGNTADMGLGASLTTHF
ncbi:DUF3187 family protein [Geothrix mesophila]|uniref:DUF3187 family protein n=1 Tax=Geothrix mesophila TaxID=2922723 RepID=UPI001FADE20D|nr:DUF3187 family protein [Geothrix sp. SG198]